jgi:hypothetical protein
VKRGDVGRSRRDRCVEWGSQVRYASLGPSSFGGRQQRVRWLAAEPAVTGIVGSFRYLTRRAMLFRCSRSVGTRGPTQGASRDGAIIRRSRCGEVRCRAAPSSGAVSLAWAAVRQARLGRGRVRAHSDGRAGQCQIEWARRGARFSFACRGNVVPRGVSVDGPRRLLSGPA